MPEAHPLLYLAPRRHKNRPLNFASIADPEANSHLRMGLERFGYRSGQSILNFPAQMQTYKLLPPAEQRVVKVPFATSGSVLVCTTRPPLSDYIENTRKKVEPSNSTLEHAIFEYHRRYLARCARSTLKFTPQALACLLDNREQHGDMRFNQKNDCFYSSLGVAGEVTRTEPKQPCRRTAAYLLSVKELWPGGPGLKAAFGMNAIATLIWCYLLSDKYSHLLERDGLTVVELEPPMIPTHADTYEWARACSVTPLLQTNIELPALTDSSREAIAG